MHKLLAVVVASTLAFGSAAGFAADAAKKDELTQEQRTDMRNRADRLVKERAQAPAPVKAQARHTPKVKPQHVKKTKKVSHHKVKNHRVNS
jgi:hypothetical protein